LISKTDSAEPRRTKLRNDSDDPKRAASMTEREKTEPKRFKPITANDDPKDAMARKENDAPRLPKSRSDKADPRAKDRTDKDDPNVVLSRTDREKTEPTRVKPSTEIVEPIRL